MNLVQSPSVRLDIPLFNINITNCIPYTTGHNNKALFASLLKKMKKILVGWIINLTSEALYKHEVPIWSPNSMLFLFIQPHFLHSRKKEQLIVQLVTYYFAFEFQLMKRIFQGTGPTTILKTLIFIRNLRNEAVCRAIVEKWNR